MRALLLHILSASFAIAALADTPQQQIIAQAGLDQKLNAQVPLTLAFRDEHGKTVKLENYFGSKPVILVLAYYECPNMCTLVLNALLESAQDLKFDAGKEYQIVVASIDPRERPALAAAKKQIYTQRYGRPGTSSGWHFLTGDESQIVQLASSVGYRFAYDPQTRQFAHPSVITVLTPAGKISRYFAGIEYPPKELRLALMEASDNRIGSLTDRFFLLCFHYNPATGKYGLLIRRVMQFAGISTVFVLGGFIALMIQREHSTPS
ncbi:MAG: SCO family protein [Verrucomicrobiota bacterium]|nr:SCO family protein [Verrucomicrobiota bacterium]MDQ2918810.1 SCO family protein [Verrucomicrobiota bacterium]